MHQCDKVVFSDKEKLTTLLTNEYGYVVGEKTLSEYGDTVVIDEHIFDADALFLPAMKSTSAKIVTSDGKDVLQMTYGKAPYLGLWAKPGAPYVCIEPWSSLPSYDGKIDDIETKYEMTALEPNETKVSGFDIIIG